MRLHIAFASVHTENMIILSEHTVFPQCAQVNNVGLRHSSHFPPTLWSQPSAFLSGSPAEAAERGITTRLGALLIPLTSKQQAKNHLK